MGQLLLCLALVATAGEAAAQVTVSTSNPQIYQGTTYNNFGYFSASGGVGPYTYAVTITGGPGAASFNGGGLVFNGNGTLSGLTCASNGNFTYTVTATDASGSTGTLSSANQVNRAPSGACGSMTLTSTTASGTVVGSSYTQTNTGSGGNTPYTYTITAGSLPAGLTLNSSTGTVSGTPTTAGPYSYTVTVTDINGNTGSQTVTGTISPAGTLAITTASLPTPVLTQAYSQTVATSGGTAPITFAVTSGTLPAGLTLNASTGAITGTATSPGAYSFTVTATDATSATATQTYSGTIAAALSITTTSLPTPVLTQTYSQTVATSGGTAPITFAVTSGTLPAGLSLNASTGAITGTPTTPGAYTFTVTATDANSLTASQTYSGTIAAALSITTTSLPAPVLTQSYSQTVATAGGTAPITFAVTSGALPAGLSLNAATGVITGTPTTPGAYSFTVTATDANGVTASRTYSGTVARVNATVTLSSSATNIVYGSNITLTATVSGVSPTGTVTFLDGSQSAGATSLSGGVATLVIANLAPGTHSFTASYGGDGRNNAAVSAIVSISVSRPNPADDPSVRRMVAAQVSAAMRAARTQMTNVQTRLDQMHGESGGCSGDELRNSADRDYCITFDGKARPQSLTSARSDQGLTQDLDKLAGGATLMGGAAPRGALAYADASRKAENPLAVFGDPTKSKPSSSPFATRINIWTAGTLVSGEVNDRGALTSNRLHTDGVTLGLDARVGSDLKAGLAFGVSNDRTRLGEDGSRLDTRNVAAMAYGSYEILRSVYLDSVVGYGALNFDQRRWSTYANDFLAGRRSGNAAYGSIALAWETGVDHWRLAPYGRMDLVHIGFGSSTESGDPTWMLTYASAHALSSSYAAGFRIAYDIESGPYRITPNARLEYGTYVNGSVSQMIGYANDNSTSYRMALPGQSQSGLLGSAGVALQRRDGPQTSLEYVFSSAGASGYSNGLRGSLRLPF